MFRAFINMTDDVQHRTSRLGTRSQVSTFGPNLAGPAIAAETLQSLSNQSRLSAATAQKGIVACHHPFSVCVSTGLKNFEQVACLLSGFELRIRMGPDRQGRV